MEVFDSLWGPPTFLPEADSSAGTREMRQLIAVESEITDILGKSHLRFGSAVTLV